MVALAHSKKGSAWLEGLAEPLHQLAVSTDPGERFLKGSFAAAPAVTATH
jgi:hypothetical protein